MTVSAQTPINRSTGNGVTTVFPYTFKVLKAADMEVSVDGVVKTLTTHYTLSGVGTDSGNVTFLVAPALNAIVVRRRNMAYTRSVDFQDQGELPTDTLDDDQDAAVLMAQQLGEGLGRAVQVPITSDTDPENLIQELLDASAAAVGAAADASADATTATAAAAAAAASAASTGLPALAGKTLNFLRVKADETGYEARTPTQARGDLTAAKSGANADITSMTALTAGGLPNATITAPNLSGGQSGSAPVFGIRAWVNFNGTGTVTINGSGNVSSVGDNGAGDYTINFITAMPTASYAVMPCGPVLVGQGAAYQFGLYLNTINAAPLLKSTTQVRVASARDSQLDLYDASVAIVC